MLDVAALVLDVQARHDSVRDDARVKTPRRGPGDAAPEEQLHAIRPPQVQVVADDLFEELPPPQGAIEDLGAADLDLQHGQLIAEPRRLILRRQGQGQLGQPSAEEALDVGRAQPVADRLQRGRIRATQEPIVQGDTRDPAPLELPLGPLVAVETDLDRIGGVAAHLDEGRAPLVIDDVDVVVVHAHRLAAEGEVHPAPLLRLARRPARGALLRDPHQDDARGPGEPRSILFNKIILLPILFLEFNPRHAPGLRPGPQPRAEGLGDPSEQRGRGNPPAPHPAQERHHPALALQAGHVAVEVQPIHTLHVQGHVLRDNLCYVGHGPLPGLVTHGRGTTHQRPREALQLPRTFCCYSSV